MRRPCLSVTVKTTLTSLIVVRMVVSESSEDAAESAGFFGTALLAAGGFVDVPAGSICCAAAGCEAGAGSCVGVVCEAGADVDCAPAWSANTIASAN